MSAPETQEQVRRAEPPRIPQASPALLDAGAQHRQELQSAEARESRSMVRGLLLLALLLLLLSIARAGLDRAFPHGWWHR